MEQSLIDRISNLERSNRRWKATSAILAAILVGVLLSGLFFGASMRQSLLAEKEAMRAVAEAAKMQEAVARAQALAAEMAYQDAIRKIPHEDW